MCLGLCYLFWSDIQQLQRRILHVDLVVDISCFSLCQVAGESTGVDLKRKRTIRTLYSAVCSKECTDVERVELLHLVLDERPQRRHDHSDARLDHCRQLVAQTLAATGRHQNERVFAEQRRVDGRQLVGAERAQTEHGVEEVAEWAAVRKVGAVEVGVGAVVLVVTHEARRRLAREREVNFFRLKVRFGRLRCCRRSLLRIALRFELLQDSVEVFGLVERARVVVVVLTRVQCVVRDGWRRCWRRWQHPQLAEVQRRHHAAAARLHRRAVRRGRRHAGLTKTAFREETVATRWRCRRRQKSFAVWEGVGLRLVHHRLLLLRLVRDCRRFEREILRRIQRVWNVPECWTWRTCKCGRIWRRFTTFKRTFQLFPRNINRTNVTQNYERTQLGRPFSYQLLKSVGVDARQCCQVVEADARDEVAHVTHDCVQLPLNNTRVCWTRPRHLRQAIYMCKWRQVSIQVVVCLIYLRTDCGVVLWLVSFDAVALWVDILDTFDDGKAEGVSNTFLAHDFREPAAGGATVLCLGGGESGMMSGRSSSKASSEKSGGGGE